MSLKYNQEIVQREMEEYLRQNPNADASAIQKKNYELVVRETVYAIWMDHHARFGTDGKDAATYEAEMRSGENVGAIRAEEYFKSKDPATGEHYLESLQNKAAADQTGKFLTNFQSRTLITFTRTNGDKLHLFKDKGDEYVRGMFAPVTDSSGMLYDSLKENKAVTVAALRDSHARADAITIEVPKGMSSNLVSFAVMGELFKPEHLEPARDLLFSSGSSLPPNLSVTDNIIATFLENTVRGDPRPNMHVCRLLLPEVRQSAKELVESGNQESILGNVKIAFDALYGKAASISRNITHTEYAFSVRQASELVDSLRESGIEPTTLGISEKKLNQLNVMKKILDFQIETEQLQASLWDGAEKYIFGDNPKEYDLAEQPELQDRVLEIAARKNVISTISNDISSISDMYAISTEAAMVEVRMSERSTSPMEQSFSADPEALLSQCREVVKPDIQTRIESSRQDPDDMLHLMVDGAPDSQKRIFNFPVSEYLREIQDEFFNNYETYLNNHPGTEEMRKAFEDVKAASLAVTPESDWRSYQTLIAPYQRLHEVTSEYIQTLPVEERYQDPQTMTFSSSARNLPRLLQSLKASRPEEGTSMDVPANLEADKKRLFSALAECAEQARLSDAFASVSGLSEAELAQNVQKELGHAADGQAQARYTDFLMTGASVVKRINSIKYQVQPDPAELEELRLGMEKLLENTDALRKDTYTLLDKLGYNALKSGDPGILHTLTEGAKACGAMKGILPAKLREHALESSVSDIQSFQNVQDEFSSTRFELSMIYPADSLSAKTIKDQYEELAYECKLGKHVRQVLKEGKDSAFFEDIRQKRSDLQREISETQDLMNGMSKNPFTTLKNFREQIANTSNPDSPFYMTQQEKARANEDARLHKIASDSFDVFFPVDTKAFELQDKVDEMKKKLDALEKNDPENRREQLLSQYQNLKAESSRTWALQDRLMNDHLDKSDALRDFRATASPQEKAHLGRLNAYLKRMHMDELGALPTEAETKEILDQIEARLMEPIDALRKEDGFSEEKYINPKEHLDKLKARDAMLSELQTGSQDALNNLNDKLAQNKAQRAKLAEAAKKYNSLCEKSPKRMAAFEKACSSANNAQRFSGDGTEALRSQLKEIAEHLDDQKRMLHRDSAEFKNMKEALQNIVGDEGAALPITREKLTALQKAAQDYIQAKGDIGRNPSNMRLVRLNAANELEILSTLHLTENPQSEKHELIGKRFLTNSASMDIVPTADVHDPEHSLETQIKAANRVLDSRGPEREANRQRNPELNGPNKAPAKKRIR